MKHCTGRIALVTGGSRGIGNAIALKLATENFKVVIADITSPEKTHENITYYYCDLTKGKDIDKLHSDVLGEIGEPDLIVLNAGIGIHELLTEGDPEKWQYLININVMAALRCIRSFVPLLVKNKKGDVVFISSVAANKPYCYGGIYSASKTALDMIAETLRLETSPCIRVTIIRAGATATNFFSTSGNLPKDNGILHAEDIAEDVFYAINKPDGKQINMIITRPANQEF